MQHYVMDDDAPETSIFERENLIPDDQPRSTGFTPRPLERLVSRRAPRSQLNIECNTHLRRSREAGVHGNPKLSYQLWVEAGRHEPPFPERPDPSYNSNVWRNFSRAYGFEGDEKGRAVREVIANMYPINIPPPSHVGQHTYARYLQEAPSLVRNARFRQALIDKSEKDVEHFKRLRMRSELRNPPLDQQGNILPPDNWKKYIQRMVPQQQPEAEAEPIDKSKLCVDMFGRWVPKPKFTPFYWKLSYKDNNPKFDDVIDEKERLKSAPRMHPPAVIRRPHMYPPMYTT